MTKVVTEIVEMYESGFSVQTISSIVEKEPEVVLSILEEYSLEAV